MKARIKKGIKLEIEGGKQLPDKTYHAHKDGDDHFIFYNREWLQINLDHFDIINEPVHPLQYVPQVDTDFKSGQGFDEYFKNITINKDFLEKIDQEQKAKGEILWRYFSTPVADGCAVYQVIKVNGKTCDVVKCYGCVPDEWEDHLLGIGCRIDRSWVEQKIKSKDAMEQLFGDKRKDLQLNKA